MKGVFVRGIEMPNSCRECVFESEVAFYCRIVYGKTEFYTDRIKEDCPLFPVKEEHGDLVDRTFPLRGIEGLRDKVAEGDEAKFVANWAAKILAGEPPVVPAEDDYEPLIELFKD